MALLSTISKLLEKVIAERLKKICSARKLLHLMQFGTEGKCTSKAVASLLNQVYRGWCLDSTQTEGLVSSLHGFDIQGAYNAVNRAKVIANMTTMNIPPWIIFLVESYLSDRRTTLELPGHVTEKPFSVDM